MKTHQLTRTALLLALTLFFQSLRLLLPLPPISSVFVIGILVNCCLLIAARTAGLTAALFISFIAPIVAYLQQLLPLPIFILPVACGNITLVVLYHILGPKDSWIPLASAAIGKCIVLYSSFTWLLTHFIQLSPEMMKAMLWAMSWPQALTAFAGGIVAEFVVKRINLAKKT